MTDMTEQMADVEPGSHLCSIYEDRVEQMAASVPFIMAGLARGERCIYVCDDRTVAEVGGLLQAAGVDVVRERERGSLWLLTKIDVYLRAGLFEPEAMVKFWEEATEQALGDGFTGLRGTGEMTWALGPEPGCERLIEYEQRLERYLPGTKGTALCQYNRARFSAELLHDAIRSHHLLILGNRLFRFSSAATDPIELLNTPTKES